MDGIGNLVALLFVAAADLVAVVLLLPLLLKRRPGRGSWVLASLAMLVLTSAVVILAGAPEFDWVDRCRPAGEGVCVDGSSYDIVGARILRDQALAGVLYVGAPVGLLAGVTAGVTATVGRWRRRDSTRS